MTTAMAEKPSESLPLVRRTYQIRPDQDEAILAMAARSRDSWSSIVRRALDVGLAAELDAMKQRNVPGAA